MAALYVHDSRTCSSCLGTRSEILSCSCAQTLLEKHECLREEKVTMDRGKLNMRRVLSSIVWKFFALRKSASRDEALIRAMGCFPFLGSFFMHANRYDYLDDDWRLFDRLNGGMLMEQCFHASDTTDNNGVSVPSHPTCNGWPVSRQARCFV